MRTLLIVDDEKAIRKGIRIMVERISSDFNHILEFSGGLEALEWLKQNKADLMIVDIRMPIMGGIELLKNVAGFDNPPECVVLSGYSEFSYAADSLKYGASAYLLKPVHRNELAETLHKIEQKLESKEKYQKKLDEAEGICKKHVQDAIISLFKGNDSFQNAQKHIDENSLKVFKERYYVCVIKKNTADEMGETEKIIKKMIAEKNISAQIWSTNEEIIVGCNNIDSLKDPFSKCGKIGKCGISNQYSDIKDMSAAYFQAREALKQHFFQPGLNFFKYKPIDNSDKSVQIQIKEIKKIANLLFTENNQELNNIIEYSFDPKVFNNKGMKFFEDTVHSIKVEIFEKCTAVIPEYFTAINGKLDMLAKPYNFNDVFEYCSTLKKVLLDINKNILLNSDITKRINDIESALAFIHSNYDKDINMANVSNHINRSYSYFSKEFKDRTGINFVDYLREYRINKAKELLEITQIRISEISLMVGYQNEKNFSTAFKSVCGVSPKDYRNNANLHILSVSDKSGSRRNSKKANKS